MADPNNRRRESARGRLDRMTGEAGGDAAKEEAEARAFLASLSLPELAAYRAALAGPALGPDRPADPQPPASVHCPDAPPAMANLGSIGLLFEPRMDCYGPDAPPRELWLMQPPHGLTLAKLREAAGGDTVRLEISFRPGRRAPAEAPEDGAA